MASKSAQDQLASAEAVAELLDTVDKTLERVKTLYEQYFLGIQKQPPTFIHNDVERKLRDLTQANIRNTGLRYRFATLQQKFGAYNSYWKRTLRQIENGTYLRSLSKIGREAARTGQEIPEEILAAMPKRMREQVLRDREQALAIAKRRRSEDTDLDQLLPPAAEEAAAMINEPSSLRRELKTRSGAHVVEEADGEVDLAAFFAEIEQESAPVAPQQRVPAPTPARMPTPAPPAPAGTPRTTPTTGSIPKIAPSQTTGSIPRIAPSQTTRPIPIAPGAAAARGAVPVDSMAGPFPRQPTPPPAAKPPVRPTPAPASPQRPPPGMSDADVNALYAKYVQAKQLVGEAAGPGARDKLLKTINAQAPKIMEQYKAKGVDFSVVVKDNQVIIRAKPKV